MTVTASGVLSICPVSGCGEFTTGGRCETHELQARAREDQRRRGKSIRWVYRHRLWGKTRRIVLERDKWTCRLCGRFGKIVDHFDPPLAEILEQGLDPFDADRCRTLCASCSGREDGARSRRTRP